MPSVHKIDRKSVDEANSFGLASKSEVESTTILTENTNGPMHFNIESKTLHLPCNPYATIKRPNHLIYLFAAMIFSLSSLFAATSAQDTSSEKQTQLGSKATPNANPTELRVLSYNIHHGAGIDGKLDLKRIAKVILSERPDLVALQEVDVNVKRSNSIDQARTLADLCNMQFAFGGNIKLQGGEYGNAVLSKFKIVKTKNTKLPNFDSGEQRGILNCTIKIAGLAHDIEFSSTHFDHRRNDAERFASSQTVNLQLKKTITPISILAGDFNDVLFGRTITELEKQWVRSNDTMLPTIPVKKPSRQIDFIFASKSSKLTCIKTKVLSEAVASDHRALLAVYQLDSK